MKGITIFWLSLFLLEETMPRSRKKIEDTVALNQIAVMQNINSSIITKGEVYNPDNISADTYSEMGTHPTISGALDVIKLPIISVDWFISGSNPARVEFVEKNLRKLWAMFIRDLLGAYGTGFQPFEKVMAINEEGYYVYDKFLALNPKYVKIKQTPQFSFDGLKIETGYKEAVIPAEKSFVFTYKREYENFYGKPRIRGAYTPWYIHRYILEFTNIFYEKYASPTLVGYAPAVKQKFQGKDVDATDYMLKVLKSVQNASSLVLPHTGGKKDELKYFIDVLESQRTGGDFLTYLKYLDNAMFTGAGIPPLAFSAGEKGSYALFEEQASLFAQGVDGDITMIKYYIDKYIIKPLIEINFGGSAKDDTQFSYQSLANRDRELTRQIMLALVQQGKIDIAVKYLVDSLGLPAREAGQMIESAKTQVKDEKPKEEKKEEPELCRHGHGFKLGRKWMRKPNELEKHINFERVEKRYNDNQAMLLAGLSPILMKQKLKFIDSLQKAVDSKDYNRIKDMDIAFRSEYGNKLTDMGKGIFEEGFEDVSTEMKADIKTPAQAKNWVVTNSQNIADKHLNDLKFAVLATALNAVSKDLSSKEVVYDASQSWDEYINSKLNDSTILYNHKVYNEGRDWAGEESGAKYAIWSAVLDTHECDFCRGRDGMVIDVSNPDLAEYAPGNVHENCRCFWVYLTNDELPEDIKEWRTPSKTDAERYYSM